MKTLMTILLAIFAYDQGRRKRVKKWGNKLYDGTNKPW